MVPPLFLDVQAHHAVLDLCAAPGSKTTHIATNFLRDADGSCVVATAHNFVRAFDLACKETGGPARQPLRSR